MVSGNVRDCIRKTFATLLSFQLGIAPLVSNAKQGSAAAPLNPGAGVKNPLTAESDPNWRAFIENDVKNFRLHFSMNDPALDQDSYFLRSQRWQPVTKSPEHLSYRRPLNPERPQSDSDSLEMYFPGSSRALLLKLPFLPIQATEDYIFLSLSSSSDLFQKAAGKNNPTGEGIFFIDRSDLEQRANAGLPVPVFFLPLGGRGWTGVLRSVHLPQSETIVIANKSESVAIGLKDVRSMMKVQQIYLMMASAMTANNRRQVTNEMYPAPGMTASFGLFFTGLDLVSPEKSLWPPNRSTSSVEKNIINHSRLRDLYAKAFNWGPLKWIFPTMSPSRADIFDPLVVTELVKSAANALKPEERERIAYVLSILGGMMAASWVIKHSFPGIRKKLNDLRDQSDVGGSLVKRSARVVKTELRETVHTFAAMTSTAAQIPGVTLAYALELFLDRLAPTVAAADHTLIRRFLTKNFFAARDSVKNVPVNHVTFIRGAIGIGGVDTATVAAQGLFVVPYLAEAAGQHLGQDMQARISETFDTNNSATREIVMADVVRNGLAYIQKGASGYSMDTQQQIIERITAEVQAQMRTEGLDPLAPENQANFSARRDSRVGIAMKLMGLPEKSEFLFDASTMVRNVTRALGYRTPEGIESNLSFILEKRSQLTTISAQRAVEVAENWVRDDGSDTAKQALAILRETADSLSLIRSGIKSGATGVRRALKVREQLTLLSYEGPIEYLVPLLPEFWVTEYSAAAAQAAALMFRQSLYSVLTREGLDLLFASPNNAERFGKEAKASALKLLREAHPEALAIDSVENLSPDLMFELKLRTQVEINRVASDEARKSKAEAYQPPKSDWVSRRKAVRAEKEAQTAFDRYLETETGRNATVEAKLAMRKQLFATSVARQVGIHVEDPSLAMIKERSDYTEMIKNVENKAENMTQADLNSNLEIVSYRGKMSETERELHSLHLYANHYLVAYIEYSTELRAVGPIDPGQPGRFQALRQTEIVRSSRFLTHTLRSLESFFDDQSIDMRWTGSIARNAPFVSDQISAYKIWRKNLMPNLSAQYLAAFYFWHIPMPYSAWTILNMTSGATIVAPQITLNRLFRVNGLAPKGSFLSAVGYGIPYSWVTFLGMFPMLLYSKDMGLLFSDYIREPLTGVLSAISIKEWVAAAGGAGLIGAVFGRAVQNRSRTAFTQGIEVFKKTFNGPASEVSGGISCNMILGR